LGSGSGGGVGGGGGGGGCGGCCGNGCRCRGGGGGVVIVARGARYGFSPCPRREAPLDRARQKRGGVSISKHLV
jgi:hypothetical protein